jgi:hypothetical protein
MQKAKKYIHSFILLFIGGLIVNTQVRWGDGCAGMMSAISFIFWILVYLMVLLAIVVKFSKKKNFDERSALNPLHTTVLVILSVIVAFNAEKFESRTKLSASTYHYGPTCYLELKENGKFVASIGHADWSCYYNGRYQIKNDTLTLSRDDIQEISDGSLSDIYLIDKEKNKLYPLDRYDRDTMYWLVID